MEYQSMSTLCAKKVDNNLSSIFESKLIQELCSYGQVKQFLADQTIMDVGNTITHMPLLLDGAIKVLTEDDDESELLLYYLQTGDTCAVTLNCCTSAKKSTIKAITETDVEVLFIPVTKIDEWMARFPSWRAYILNAYNMRLHEMLRSIDGVVFHNLEERLRSFLKDKSKATGSKKLSISHQQIANEMNSSRVVISRLMKKLEKEGFLKQSRNMVEID